MTNGTPPIEALRSICVVLTIAASLSPSHDRVWAMYDEGPPKADRKPRGPRGVEGAEPQIVARVNGEPVTRAELQRELANPLERQQLVRKLGVQQTDNKDLGRLALRKLINRRLILQEAARRNLGVTEQELDQGITSLRRRFKDLGSFGAWMKEQGLDDETLFEAIRAEMVAARVRAALVEGVRVTDEQAQRYYEDHKEELRVEEVRLQIIVVKDKAAAEEIMAALGKHDDFGGLARQRSLGRRAARGGDTGWVASETLSPPLRDVVATLKPRDARGPLPRGAEFLVVRLGGRRLGRTKSLAEARPEIERRLLPTTQQEVIQAWLTEQEKRARIEVFTWDL